MDKYIYDENNGLWYELQGGISFSLTSPPRSISPSACGVSATADICVSTKAQSTPAC